MNKKIILPLAVAAMGFASCNGATVLDTANAAKEMIDSAEATITNLNNNTLGLNLNIGNADITYANNNKSGSIEKRVANIKLSNTKANLKAAVNNIGKFQKDDDDNVNNLFRGAVNLNDVNLSGSLKISLTSGGKVTDYNLASIDNLGGINANVYINKLTVEEEENDLAYVALINVPKDNIDIFDIFLKGLNETDFNAYDEAIGLPSTEIKSYKKVGNAIKSAEDFITLMNSDDKKGGYSVIENLSPSFVNGNFSEILGDLGHAIQYSLPTLFADETKREEMVNTVAEKIEEIKKEYPELSFSAIKNGNALSLESNITTDNLNALINKLIKSEEVKYIEKGSVKISLSSNDSKCISNFNISVNDLSTAEITPETVGETIKVDDLSMSINLDLGYLTGGDDDEAFKNIPTSIADYILLDD